MISLSVSSFPEAPPNLVRRPKWQVTPSLKSGGRFLGTLLSKPSLPSLNGIGHIAKSHVKRGIVRQRANVSRPRWLSKRHSSLTRSSSIVIDITPISNNNNYSSASSEVDASSVDPMIEISLSPTINPAALSSPTVTKDSPAISPTDPAKGPYQPSVQSLASDSTHAPETAAQHPGKEHEEVSPADFEPHNPQPPNSETATPLPTSLITQSPSAPPVPSTEGRRRSHSASAGVKASATKTEPLTLHRYKSETAIGLPRLTVTPSEPIPQPPATGRSTHTSDSIPTKKQQLHETIFKRVRARSDGASSKSTGSNKDVESPPLRARMFSLRSLGSRLSVNSQRRPSTAPPLPQLFSSIATALVPVPKSSPPEQTEPLVQPPHLRPNTSDVAASPPLPVVGPGSPDDDSEQSPPPVSIDKGVWLRLAAVPHAESWDGDQQRRRPRTAPETVSTASW